MKALVTYILSAITSWAGIHGAAPARFHAIAEHEAAFATKVAAREGGDASRIGLMVAAIGQLESGYAPWVGDGSCNLKRWREAHESLIHAFGGDVCDGGDSFTYWQVMVSKETRRVRPGGPTGPEMLVSDDVALEEVWRQAGASLRAGHGLCDYVGERYPHCPKAELRTRLVEQWEREHPFELAQE